MTTEYARFGDSYVERVNDGDWRTAADAEAAKAAIDAKELETVRARRSPAGFAMITRSDRNEEIAAELGLTGDELADRLALPGNQGTRRRVSDDEFDALMAELGLSPEEARARLRGTYWS